MDYINKAYHDLCELFDTIKIRLSHFKIDTKNPDIANDLYNYNRDFKQYQ